MKLITLNIWGGTVYEPLINFIKNYSKEVDIFCFQEVNSTDTGIKESRGIRANMYQEIEKVLFDFNGFYAPQFRGIDFKGSVNFNLETGLAIFIRKNLKVTSHGDVFIRRKRFDKVDMRFNSPNCIQYLTFQSDGKEFLICNFHGKARPGTKLDNKQRIRQSNLINNFLSNYKIPTILAGDFNLMPETKSVAILEINLRNLVKDFKITSTRSQISLNMYPDNPQYFADYIFTSPDIKVEDSRAINVEISDHLPLIVEFS